MVFKSPSSHSETAFSRPIWTIWSTGSGVRWSNWTAFAAFPGSLCNSGGGTNAVAVLAVGEGGTFIGGDMNPDCVVTMYFRLRAGQAAAA